MKTRLAALEQLKSICQDHRALSTAALNDADDSALAKAICFGVCRFYFQLGAVAEQLLEKPFKEKDLDILLVLKMGLFQCGYMQVKDHAALNETVALCDQIKKPWSKGVINACLHRFIENKEGYLSKAQNCFGPFWLTKLLKKAHPEQWRDICQENLKQAPMWLRVNRCTDVIPTQAGLSECILTPTLDSHLRGNDNNDKSNDIANDQRSNTQRARRLQVPVEAIKLPKPIPPENLPGFTEGSCYVQDLSPQFAPHLLDLEPNQKVLDACAAPGGKSLHLLEVEPSIDLLCLDHDAKRLERLHENFARFGKTANAIVADAADIDSWFDGNTFDRILLDAPCSATGVIRRHPDINLLRRATDINELHQTQLNILKALFSTLKTGGVILYATCSILPQENDQSIAAFLNETPQAKLEKIDLPIGHGSDYGWQILPGDGDADGFYYSKILKA